MSWDEMCSQLEQLFRNAGGRRNVGYIRMGTGAYRQFCKAWGERQQQKKMPFAKISRPISPHFRGLRIYIDDRLEAEQIEMIHE